MARNSSYSDIVHHGMPVAERMALALSLKTQEEWERQRPEAQAVWAGMVDRMLMQTACPTTAVIVHAREALSRRMPEAAALSDDQLAEIWEALVFGIGAESQNNANGYSKDGGPKPDAA